MPSLDELSTAIKATEDWINDLVQRLGWHHRQQVYLALLASLHALRDVLPRDQAVSNGAQLPSLLRGLYYEGWHPSARPMARSRAAFPGRIHDGVNRELGIDLERGRPNRARLARRTVACNGGRGRQSVRTKTVARPMAKLSQARL